MILHVRNCNSIEIDGFSMLPVQNSPDSESTQLGLLKRTLRNGFLDDLG